MFKQLYNLIVHRKLPEANFLPFGTSGFRSVISLNFRIKRLKSMNLTSIPVENLIESVLRVSDDPDARRIRNIKSRTDEIVSFSLEENPKNRWAAVHLILDGFLLTEDESYFFFLKGKTKSDSTVCRVCLRAVTQNGFRDNFLPEHAVFTSEGNVNVLKVTDQDAQRMIKEGLCFELILFFSGGKADVTLQDASGISLK